MTKYKRIRRTCKQFLTIDCDFTRSINIQKLGYIGDKIRKISDGRNGQETNSHAAVPLSAVNIFQEVPRRDGTPNLDTESQE
jgi:hypothetical protein